jgi:hypothetical protein
MNFYLISLIIAIGILIICLVGIGLLMQFQGSDVKFPLHPNTCPDLWTLSSDATECTSPDLTTNKGTLQNPASGNHKLILGAYKTTCDKKKWAKGKGINWDGVSNYNGC